MLLYGNSFAQCVTEPGECWEGLLEESEFGATHRLLNHGVGGYGLDKAVLLLERSLPRHIARDPLVVIGILIDDGLDRCALQLRDFPKPSFERQAGGLALQPPSRIVFAALRAGIAREYEPPEHPAGAEPPSERP